MNALVHERADAGWQAPTSGKCATAYSDLYAIITHPAFRLGFLDAQHGKPLNHDLIGERIFAETPQSYFKRQKIEGLFSKEYFKIELSQYRYEEGRLAVVKEGLNCKAWGHPDFPPAKLRDYIWKRSRSSDKAAT